MRAPDQEQMLRREAIANETKHWVRAVTACNSRCLFCLDSDTPRGVFLSVEDVRADLRLGRERGATRVVISGGEASLHPEFMAFVAYAKELGYRKVQTVTNGFFFGEPAFLEQALDAGLGEITYSLHGHTAALHDRLTGTPGAFRRITRAIVNSIADGRPIVNVDVCINKQNVGVLDKIVELSMALGVREFDLLHVIPQASAFDNRDELFYDPKEHLGVLHKVFRLARHPRVTVWTNRFPVPYLEGLEDLIQDPHKMLDEINGRRFMVQRYLDHGAPFDCRDPERCQHCFIAPMCTTLDETVTRQKEARFEVWDIGELPEAPVALPDGQLPFGCTRVGVQVEDRAGLLRALEEIPAPLRVRSVSAISLEDLPAETPLELIAVTTEQLERWIADVPEGCPHTVEVQLSADVAPWLLANAALLARHADRVRLHQPSHELLRDAREQDLRFPRRFFAALAEATVAPLEVSGLPVCLAPGMRYREPTAVLERSLFGAESGRLQVDEVARLHVRSGYRAKSLRCRECVVEARCRGAHINLLRDQGLGILTPLGGDAEADAADARLREVFPEPLPDVAKGAPPVGASPSLPGFAAPTEAVRDPLGLIAEERLLRRRRAGAGSTT